MHFRLLKSVSAVLLLLPAAAFAETFSYRFVDAAFLPSAKIDAGGIDQNGEGFQLRGSLPVYENFFALTEFQQLNLDNSVDSTRILIGAGAHWPINNQFDVIARGGVIYYKVDFGRFDDDDTGLWIGGRVRAIVAPQFEVEGGVEYQRVEVGGLRNDTFLIGEARYNFTPQWSGGVSINFGGDTTIFGLQGRFNF